MSTTKTTPADVLRDLERKAFDSIGAVSYAIQHGLIHRVLIGAHGNGFAATIIPQNPAEQPAMPFHGPTPIHALLEMGQHLDHMICKQHAEGLADHQQYHQSKGATAELRKERKIILTMGGN